MGLLYGVSGSNPHIGTRFASIRLFIIIGMLWSRATYVFFMVVVREDSINFLPCAGFDSLRKDKILFLLIHNCECIVSTQSVRIALIFHNGFCRVRFPIMEQVFFMFLPLPCCTIQQVGVSAKKKMQQIPDFYFKKKYYNRAVLCGTLPR